MKTLYKVPQQITEVEILETWQGSEVRVLSNGKWLYVAGYYNKEYVFVTDYLYARHYSASVANDHLKRLEKNYVANGKKRGVKNEKKI